jgi:hypothetical protein
MSLQTISSDQELLNAFNTYKANVETYRNSPAALKERVKDSIEILKANALYETTATDEEKQEIETMLTEVSE